MKKSPPPPQIEAGAIAFIFDASHPTAGFSYGDKFERAFFSALKSADKNLVTRSLILRGDLLIHGLCYKPVRVSAGWKTSRRGTRSWESSSELAGDKALLAVLVGDLVDAIEEQWNTFDEDHLWSYIANHNLDCIFLPSFPTGILLELDALLRSEPCYIGAVVTDLGNPLQRELFVNSLIRVAFISDGIVHFALEFDGHLESSLAGAEDFSKGGFVTLSQEQFAKLSPPIKLPAKLSERGLVTMTRLTNRSSHNVHERLVRELSTHNHRPSVEFDWDLRQLPTSADEAEVQAGKITDYLLNESHPDGKAKAEFFRRELDITTAQWQFLRAQILDALVNAKFDDVRYDQYGVRFNSNLPIVGRNSRTATVKTAWIVRPGERASLVTAFPGVKDSELELQAQEPPLVPPNFQGEERWQALFTIALERANQAAASCVPTPMKIVDGPLELEGACGGAYVLVPDARKDLLGG